MLGRWKRILVGFLLTLTVLLGGTVAYPFIVGDGKPVLDATVRSTMPKKTFVALSDGITSYEWAGPASGQPVVLVHGITSPSFLWDYQFDVLAQAGFHVLRYDLYGRGFSDRPAVRYTDDLYDRQLLELLDALQVTKPVHLVGHSMGGAISVKFTDRHPERVARLALLAPAGFPVEDIPLKYRLLKAPLIGDWFLRMFGEKALKSGLKWQVRSDPKKSAQFQEDYLEQLNYAGYTQALLSTLRHTPLLTLQPVYERVGTQSRPILLLWGTKDKTVPYAHHLLAQKALPSVQFHALENEGHIFHYEHPEKINPLLLTFLRGSSNEEGDTSL